MFSEKCLLCLLEIMDAGTLYMRELTWVYSGLFNSSVYLPVYLSHLLKAILDILPIQYCKGSSVVRTDFFSLSFVSPL